MGALALGLIGTLLHEEFEQRHPRIDYAGAVLVLASVGTAIFGLLQGGQAWPWLSATSLAIFAAAAVLLALTVWVERRAAEPVMPGWLWRRRELAVPNLAMLGMGAVLMAPSAYLPTFAQSVQGLGAIAAGLVLATMSLGWPAASAVSGQLYMRVGFRDTALAGALLLLAASIGFVLIPAPQAVWAVVAVQVTLGAGLGLVSTSLLVGVQSVVGWDRRGVVTGANMFSRYLGQSLGAALFGAIFNAVVAGRLADAPAAVAAGLPEDVNGVIAALHSVPAEAGTAAYLRDTIGLATRDLYLGMAAIAVVITIVLLAAPRRFPVLPAEAG